MKQNYQWQQPNKNQLNEDLQRRKDFIQIEMYREQKQQDPKIWLQNKRRSRRYEQGKLKQIPKQYLIYTNKSQKTSSRKQNQNKFIQKELQSQKSAIQNRRLQDQKKIKQNPALLRKIKQSQLRILQKDNQIKSIQLQNSNLRSQIDKLRKQVKQVNAYCYLHKQQLRRIHQQLKGKITESSSFGYEQYRKLVDFAKTTNQWLPSDRNQLSNRIKLQKFEYQYLNYQKRSQKTIAQFQQIIVQKDLQLQQLKRHNQILQVSLQKMTDLKDFQRSQNYKKKRIIQEYQRQISQLIQHNKKISQQLEKYYNNPITKQKIGFIVQKKGNIKT